MIFVPASHVDVAKPPKLRSAAAAIRAKRAVRRSGEG
jgi:hypothetical protein